MGREEHGLCSQKKGDGLHVAPRSPWPPGQGLGALVARGVATQDRRREKDVEADMGQEEFPPWPLLLHGGGQGH